ncbi:hypothetical protein CC2G_000235 [Coprinopsis cinerea AmutBmut pab1-1]|nr:hypothetical protein CC2G_000235 [Coprinopsis cinerea AmutBmut pab1-1]
MSRTTRSTTRAQASSSRSEVLPKKEESEDETGGGWADMKQTQSILRKRKDDKKALSMLHKKLGKARLGEEQLSYSCQPANELIGSAKQNTSRKKKGLRDRLKTLTNKLRDVEENLNDLNDLLTTVSERCSTAKAVIEEELNDISVYRSDDSECMLSEDELSSVTAE